MQIDWVHFSPWSALLGGALVGVASALLLLSTGRIAGISGIVARLLEAGSPVIGWRLAFVGGLIAAPSVLAQLIPNALAASPWAIDSAGAALLLALAGVCVGVGTRLANGCTSGHGVCGLARFSPRALAAVLVFMGTAMAVVFVRQHLIGGGA